MNARPDIPMTRPELAEPNGPTREALVAALAALRTATRAIEAALASDPSRPDNVHTLGINPDLLKLKATAREFGLTEATLRRWAIAHNLGQMVGGRWFISRSRLQAYIAGVNVLHV
ncbi:helix-turn-helix domain-containing protein [Microvirga yunnanensis]|uniref:helix-turn-helix domain-containing protein n=1 Tax=Microvirga yunnanensis TaxID=2953740 RepID=UPI0021C81F04|nr:helix-turn-helix domain-containing protein [Microvirga sp. HBU65207]